MAQALPNKYKRSGLTFPTSGFKLGCFFTVMKDLPNDTTNTCHDSIGHKSGQVFDFSTWKILLGISVQCPPRRHTISISVYVCLNRIHFQWFKRCRVLVGINEIDYGTRKRTFCTLSGMVHQDATNANANACTLYGCVHCTKQLTISHAPNKFTSLWTQKVHHKNTQCLINHGHPLPTNSTYNGRKTMFPCMQGQCFSREGRRGLTRRR